MSTNAKIENVNVVLKANVYFDGKVVSHSVELRDGSKKTVGLIYPGSFTFNTEAPERMDIIAGTCKVRVDKKGAWKIYAAGTHFEVSANSSFDITVDHGIAEYLCTYQ